jgi:hypothetical protein
MIALLPGNSKRSKNWFVASVLTDRAMAEAITSAGKMEYLFSAAYQLI